MADEEEINLDLIEESLEEDIPDEDESVCSTCGGTGEVGVMGRVYPNEPHMAMVDTEPCPDCHPREEHDGDGEDD